MQERPQSALVVLVPEAEPVVRRHRHALDPSTQFGVPAHITVLYPFVPPEHIDETILERVARIAADSPSHEVRLSRTAWFGRHVLWLAPDDPEPFSVLTERVSAAFPDHPPYEGTIESIIPHLTVGDRAPVAAMEEAERCLLQDLPIDDRVTHLTLLAQERAGGHFTTKATFPFGNVALS